MISRSQAFYNVCKAAAALTAARTMGWDMDICCAALADFRAVFGRMEQLTVGETSVRIVLVKNPAGCDRALEFLASQSEDVLPIFCLNDNAADGTDVSWIWDADYESLLAARRYASIGVYGVRAQDMRLRLKYAGADDAAHHRIRHGGRSRRGGAESRKTRRRAAELHIHAHRARQAVRARRRREVLGIMELNICHLYPDVLNLYGDRGNIACMKKRLEWRGIGCAVTELPLGTADDLTGYRSLFHRRRAGL